VLEAAAMAYRELHMVEMREVLRLWKAGMGFRAVAKRTGTDRKTVRRYVAAAVAAGLEQGGEDLSIDDRVLAAVAEAVRPGGSTEVGDMRIACREHRKLLEGWYAEGCKGPKMVRLLARHARVKVPLRTLQRFVEEELAEADRGTVRIVDGKPGELEVDFLELGEFVDEKGETQTMHALLCTAMYSRHQFVWPCLRQTRTDFIEGLEAAWTFFGGVFPVIISDNPKAVVDVPDPVAPKLNLAFVEYAQSRDFLVDPARVKSPKDKARVERQVQYVRNDFFRGERFRSVREARSAATEWCLEQAGKRIHGRTRVRPLDRFEAEERSILKPAPQEPYDPPKWTWHKVGPDHAIVVGYALYSVPRTVEEGSQLHVRSDRTTVKFYLNRQFVKMHARQPQGGTSIDPADLPPDTIALATRDGTSLQERANKHGEHVGEYARKLLEGPLPWSRMRHVYRLLALADRHGAEATNEACRRALEVGVVEVVRIDRMLRNGLTGPPAAAPPPRTARTSERPRFARDPSEFAMGMADAEA
jgi:transposase